jgi:acetyltransferase-like isoleucine patch superfamily enzyme
MSPRSTMLREFTLKIRRKESPFYVFLYDAATFLRRLNVPEVLLPVYRLLYLERKARLAFFGRLVTLLYYEPLFRCRCKKVGKRLRYVKLQGNFPYIEGNIQIYLGENVTVHSRSTFGAAKVYDFPRFMVGDRTYLGPGLSIAVASEISIGSRCYIAANVVIADNDGHPADPVERSQNLPISRDGIRPVHIHDDVWIGEGACILKGITIGECAIVAARSVVTGDVQPYTIVAGNPARPIGRVR